LVNVTDLLAPVLPTSTVPHVIVLTESVTGVIPVPVKLTVSGLNAALFVTVSVPVSAPTMVGS